MGRVWRPVRGTFPFFMVSEKNTKKPQNRSRNKFGFKDIWVPKKSQNRSRRKFGTKKVPEPVWSGAEKSLGTGLVQICGSCHTLEIGDGQSLMGASSISFYGVNLLALKMESFTTFPILWFSALFTLSRLSSLVGVRERDLCPLSPAPLRCQHRHPSQPTPHNTLIGKNTFPSDIFPPSPLSIHSGSSRPTAIHKVGSLTLLLLCVSNVWLSACSAFHLLIFIRNGKTWD